MIRDHARHTVRSVLLFAAVILGTGCSTYREVYRESSVLPQDSYVVDEVIYGGAGTVVSPITAGYYDFAYDPFWYLGGHFATGFAYVPTYYSTYAGYPFYIDYFWHYPVYGVVSRPWTYAYWPRYPFYSPPPVYRPPHRPGDRPGHQPGLGPTAREAVRLANRPPTNRRLVPEDYTQRPGTSAPRKNARGVAGEAARLAGPSPTGSRQATAGAGSRSAAPTRGAAEATRLVRPATSRYTSRPVREATTRPAAPRSGIPLPTRRPATVRRAPSVSGTGDSISTARRPGRVVQPAGPASRPGRAVTPPHAAPARPATRTTSTVPRAARPMLSSPGARRSMPAAIPRATTTPTHSRPPVRAPQRTPSRYSAPPSRPTGSAARRPPSRPQRR